jgi:hypothetical protein
MQLSQQHAACSGGSLLRLVLLKLSQKYYFVKMVHELRM